MGRGAQRAGRREAPHAAVSAPLGPKAVPPGRKTGRKTIKTCSSPEKSKPSVAERNLGN